MVFSIGIIATYIGGVMYLDSDTKVIISGAVILLVGIIVWKKQSFFIALVFCVLCFVFCLSKRL